jgi:DNA-binding response OmpR family regulator
MTPFTCPTCGTAHALAEITLTDSGLFFRGEKVKMVPQLFKVFRYLYTHPRPCRLTELYDALYEINADYGNRDENIVRVVICRLRQAIRDLPFTIVTTYDTGYSLQPKAPAHESRSSDHRSARA